MSNSPKVFPARAGVSRRQVGCLIDNESVPRASGGEPLAIFYRERENECSPRERG